MITLTRDGKSLTLLLEDCSDASIALVMRELLIHAEVDDIDTIQLDASAVVKIDVAILQVLLSWCNFLETRQITWHWRAASDSFRQAAQYVGLVHAFRLVSGQSA